MPSCGVLTPHALVNAFQTDGTVSCMNFVNCADVPEPSDLTTSRIGRWGMSGLSSALIRLSSQYWILPVKISAIVVGESVRLRICWWSGVWRLYIIEVPPATSGRYAYGRLGCASSCWYGI